jgi:chemotaxis response regulator CheB
MDVSPAVAARVLVIARPALGRKIEMALQMAGHEVYRTPDPSAAGRLDAQLRPDVAVIALDLPWGDAASAVARLSSSPRAIPVLVLGDAHQNGVDCGLSRLPLEADATDLRESVADLLRCPHEVAKLLVGATANGSDCDKQNGSVVLLSKVKNLI